MAYEKLNLSGVSLEISDYGNLITPDITADNIGHILKDYYNNTICSDEATIDILITDIYTIQYLVCLIKNALNINKSTIAYISFKTQDNTYSCVFDTGTMFYNLYSYFDLDRYELTCTNIYQLKNDNFICVGDVAHIIFNEICFDSITILTPDIFSQKVNIKNN
jgi:hypothetical protein